jgi:TatD DNase family protein
LPRTQVGEEIKKKQQELFFRHIELSKKHHLPLIIHCRDAYADMISTLITYKPKFVLHCMSGDLEYLKKALALGGYISFAGNVTYPKAIAIQELALVTPLNKMFIETDAPYLPPQTHRGETADHRSQKPLMWLNS